MQARRSAPPSDDYVDVASYFAILRRRAPIIILMVLLGVGAALGYSKLQTPIYTATAQVLVKPPPGSEAQNINNVISMDTEAQLVKSEQIADLAAKTIHWTGIATQLLKHVSAKTTPGSFVMGISYWDPNREAAAAGANAFAKAYVEYKRQQGQGLIDQQRQVYETQINELQTQLNDKRRILSSSPPGSAAARGAREALAQINVQLTILTTSLASVPSFVDPGEVILPAQPPKAPSSPKVPLNVALGLILGLGFGLVAAFVRDRADTRVYDESDVQHYLDVPALAYIPHVRGRRRERGAQLIVRLEPRSPAAEAFRTIRSSVLSMASRRDINVFAIASPIQGEGKSMMAANVAAALGQTDKRVLVMSADIRRPRLHEFFGVPTERGLVDVLEGECSFGEAVQRSEVGGVWVLAGGRLSSGPAELLQSRTMSDLIAEVRNEFDFVIVDCPPVLGLADCLALLPLVDAVVLVVQSGKTPGWALVEVSDRLERVGVSVDGVILNDVRVQRGRPGHHTYGYYLAPDDSRAPVSERPPRRTEPHLTEPSPGDARSTHEVEEETEATVEGLSLAPTAAELPAPSNGEATMEPETSKVSADEA